jgi:hypothetical protein
VSPSFLELRISRWCTLACGGGTSSWLRAFEGATRFSSGTLRTRGLRLVELEETLGVLAMIFLFFFNFLFFLHFSFHFSFHFFSLSSLHSLSLALIGCRKWRCQRASTHTRTRTHTHTHTHTHRLRLLLPPSPPPTPPPPPHNRYGDAANLGWKLVAACQGWGTEVLLNSYDRERRAHIMQTALYVLRATPQVGSRRKTAQSLL